MCRVLRIGNPYLFARRSSIGQGHDEPKALWASKKSNIIPSCVPAHSLKKGKISRLALGPHRLMSRFKLLALHPPPKNMIDLLASHSFLAFFLIAKNLPQIHLDRPTTSSRHFNM
ncbi:hypothetical protein PGT21_011770 [Puccinia graminis f. sp. tritici]|uniref:Uncharacterized protein n=1 Tax=Puccinia graminis f. sp. tritici TaxID=56615 RepID=A0A5B0NN78_PUCGR|nr:hypothetical protein PGT21_011770 [Puccinia graminis f. sp. tritici]